MPVASGRKNYKAEAPGTSTRSSNFIVTLLTQGLDVSELSIPDYDEDMDPTRFQVPSVLFKYLLECVVDFDPEAKGAKKNNKGKISLMATKETVIDTKRAEDETIEDEPPRTMNKLILLTESSDGTNMTGVRCYDDKSIAEGMCSELQVVCEWGDDLREGEKITVGAMNLNQCTVGTGLVEDWFIKLVRDTPVLIQGNLNNGIHAEPAGWIKFCCSPKVDEDEPGDHEMDEGFGEDPEPANGDVEMGADEEEVEDNFDEDD